MISGSSKHKALGLWEKGKDLPINKVFGKIEKVYICIMSEK